MSSIERSSRIDAPPSEVWSTLARFDAIAFWAPNVDHACLLTGSGLGADAGSEVGAVVVGSVRRVQVGRTVLTETITEWQPGVGLSYSIAGLPPVAGSVANSWHIEPVSSGSLVRLVTHIESGSRPPQRLVAKVIGRKLGEASEQMLAGLRAHIHETRTTS